MEIRDFLESTLQLLGVDALTARAPFREDKLSAADVRSLVRDLLHDVIGMEVDVQ